MSITDQEICEWIERKFKDFSVSKRLSGKYGLVWFLTHKSFPKTEFAVKTVKTEKELASGQDIVQNLRREFRIWLELPRTYNVLGANGIDVGTFWDGERKEEIKLPFMRMPVAKGSLKDWIERPADYPEADRLLALAQALNGLQYLYDHDVEAHGDLKPDNLLYDDLRSTFRLNDQPTQPTWPSIKHPWRIQVADLGWANAYKELGLSSTSCREYTAPERFGEQEQKGHVVPVKSDMFSMGVIAAELLQGSHPAPNNVQGSDGRWKKWVDSGERNLKNINSSRLRSVIEQCLAPSPEKRPSALRFLNEIVVELEVTHRLEVAETLELWRRPIIGHDNSVALNDHAAWASAQAQNLGGKQAQVSLGNTLDKLNSLSVDDFESLEAWVSLAETVIQSTVENSDEQIRIRDLASEHLVAILAPLDKPAVKQIPSRSDLIIREFERFAMLLGRVVGILGVTVPPLPEHLHLGAYAKSALYFDSAGECRWQHDLQATMEMLSSAIAEAPDEPMNYYFRALWTYLPIITELSIPALDTIEEIFSNLDMAIKLDPDWEEPNKLKKELLVRFRP